MYTYDEMIQPEEFSILNVFTESEYIIPIYQRNYAWESTEIEQLLDDINDSDGRYYLGSLIINQRDANQYEVIDGQQRLTTLFLLLAFLETNTINQNSLRFEAREKSNRTLADIIKLQTNQELPKEPFYSGEIINGFSVIRRYFNEHNEKEQTFQIKFVERLENIIVIRTQVPRNIDLNHYFEVMNTRGEQLELHEMVKANLLSVIDKEYRTMATEIWDACAQMDKYVQMCFKKEKREIIFGSDWDKFEYEDFDKLYYAFENESLETQNKEDNQENENESTLKDILLKDNKNGDSSNLNDSEENERFESIVSFPHFLLLVNEAMNYTNVEDDSGLDDKKFIDLMKLHYSSNEKAKEFIFSLLKYRFLFDKYIIKREFARDYKAEERWSLQRLKAYTDKDRKKPNYRGTYNSDDSDNTETIRLKLLQSCLRITYTSPKTMHWISKALSVLNNNVDSDCLILCLEKYACNKIKKSDYKKRSGFGIERIVFTYLDYVLCRDNPNIYSNSQFQYRNSIEHFYPQHPIKNNPWDSTDLNNFGNLALITVSANSKFSNLLPHQKVENFSDNIRQSPKLMKMRDEMETNNGRWDRDTMLKHATKMQNILDEELKKIDGE